MQEGEMTGHVPDPTNQITVGRVSRNVRDSETTFQIGSHPPKGFNVLVVWNAVMFVASLALEYVVLFHQVSKWVGHSIAPALVLGLPLLGSLALMLDAIWWRRVCMTGTETVTLR